MFVMNDDDGIAEFVLLKIEVEELGEVLEVETALVMTTESWEVRPVIEVS